MRLYVANCTLQYHVFNYRLPERNNSFTQPIASGKQVQLSGDMNLPEITAIIDQAHRYGLCTVEEAKSPKRDTPITFIASIDKPVTPSLMRDVVNHNRGVLTMRGKETRELAALAASSNMANQAHTPNAANQLELSIEEQTNSTLQDADQNLLSEGYRVGDGSPGNTGGDGGNNKRGGKRSRRS